jgi:hypothetical protein
MNFWINLKNLNIDVNILSDIGIALITTLIPLSIFIFGQKREFNDLDINVISDYIIQVRFFLLYLGLIFLPLLFWNISPPEIRFLGLTLWSIGVYFLTKILTKIYHWIKKDRFKLRFDYLKNLNDLTYLQDVWYSVWQEKISINHERRFLEIFFSKINDLLEKKSENNLVVSNHLLEVFLREIDKRELDSLLIAENDQKSIFAFILKCHFINWKQEYFNIKLLELIIIKIIEKALTEEEPLSYYYTKPIGGVIKNHLNEIENKYKELESEKKILYITEFLNNILWYFIEDENFSKKEDLWKYIMPNEYKITTNNLKDENKRKIINESLLENFLDFLFRRLNSYKYKKIDFDEMLDKISRNLFPTTDPILWSRILIFFYSYICCHSNDHHIKIKSEIELTIENNWSFGYFSRVKIFTGEEWRVEVKKSFDSESEETFNLAYFLFPKIFTKDNLQKYINELKNLKYKDEEKKLKKEELLNVFQKMFDYKYSNQQN